MPKKYRHEIKLLLTKAEYLAARAKLAPIMEQDEFTLGSGDYFIRSLYFDDLHKSSYWEKIAGVADRKKYRLRIYNLSDSVIKLECKEKKGSRIHKRAVTVSREIADSIIRGDFSPLAEIDNELAKEVYSLYKRNGLSPSVIVDYDREAYVHPVSNVRLTFDKALHAGISSADIFDEELTTLPIYPEEYVIFEVKYDDVLPKHLARIISSCGGVKLALSKFCLCRDKLLELKPKY